MTQYKYNPWPLGQIPSHLRRQEIKMAKDSGYQFEDPRELVEIFENKVAEFAGSKYAVAVDCCTHAIELCLAWLELNQMLPNKIAIPEQTYVSVYQTCQRFRPTVLLPATWDGRYQIIGTNIIDAAVQWMPDMYVDGTFHCVSFQIKKPIPIGRGGMILTNDEHAAEWLRLARYDGRDLATPYDAPDHVKYHRGWHYYMTPEDAARGIMLMDNINWSGNAGGWQNYPPIQSIMHDTE